MENLPKQADLQPSSTRMSCISFTAKNDPQDVTRSVIVPFHKEDNPRQEVVVMWPLRMSLF